MSCKSQTLRKPDTLKDVQILVVDNDADSRYLYTCLFETYGAQVMTIESIADAITLLEYFVPDILICEAKFVNEDVLSLIRRIKAIDLGRKRAISIVIASAYYSANFTQNLLAVVDSYLLKPIDVDYLVDEVWSLANLTKTTQKVSVEDWVENHIARNKQHAIATTHSMASLS